MATSDPPPPRSSRALIAIVAGVATAALLAGVAWFVLARTSTPPIALRVCGSNVIASTLGFDLIQGFFSRAGGTKIEVTPYDATGEATVAADLGGSHTRVAIRADGSGTAYAAIADGTCQAALVDRPPTPDELARIHNRYAGASADMTRTVAVDGVAAIVNPANPLYRLTLAQLRGIVSGETTDWKALGGPPGVIAVKAPPAGSDLANIVVSGVLDGGTIAASAERIASSPALASAVARDRNALGIVAASDAASAKVVALAGAGTSVFVMPTVATIGVVYPLTIKLGLYAPARGENALSAKLADYLGTDDAKNVIGNAGFVPAGP
jgi:phosphate transport system substrate-binding protein